MSLTLQVGQQYTLNGSDMAQQKIKYNNCSDRPEYADSFFTVIYCPGTKDIETKWIVTRHRSS